MGHIGTKVNNKASGGKRDKSVVYLVNPRGRIVGVHAYRVFDLLKTHRIVEGLPRHYREATPEEVKAYLDKMHGIVTEEKVEEKIEKEVKKAGRPKKEKIESNEIKDEQ